MTKQQKILTTVAWGLLVVLMVGIVVSRQRPQSETVVANVIAPERPEVLFPSPSFSLLDQEAKRFGSEELKGKVWVAQFIFTHCAGPCPMMLGKMKQLQSNMADPNVHLVSFTVDPERDTPAVLKEKAEQLHADHSRWHFLTGTKEEIDSVADGMKTTANRPKDAPIEHGTHFLLFDAKGNCRGIYNNSEETKMDELRAKASLLLAERGAQ